MNKNMKEIRKLMTTLAVFLLVASTAAALPSATNIVINDASGNPNTFVSVPVNITNVLNESIAGVVLDISFDSSVINLTANRVEKGALTSAWDSPSFNPANGRLSIVFTGEGTEIPVGSSGSIVILNFSVVGAPGTSSVMNIDSVQLSNITGDIGTASTVSGTFTVPGGQVGELTSIVISPSATTTLTVGGTQQFMATANDQNDNPMSGINISWTSSNLTVGTVSPSNATTGADGKASAIFSSIATGEAMIEAANGSLADSAFVTVIKEIPNGVPEFSGIILPIASIMGLIFILLRRKK